MPEETSSATIEPQDLEALTQSTLDLVKHAHMLEKKVKDQEAVITGLREENKSAQAKERVLLEKVASVSPAKTLVDQALDQLLDARLITQDTRSKFASTDAAPEEVFGSLMTLITEAFQHTPELGHSFRKEASRKSPGARPADPHGDFAFLKSR